MCERLLRQSVCLHSQSPPQKLCVDDESLDSLVLVRTGAAINEGALQPRRMLALALGLYIYNTCITIMYYTREETYLYLRIISRRPSPIVDLLSK